MIKKLLVILGLLVVVLIGVGVYVFVIDDDEVAKDTVGCDPEPCEASTVDAADGTWTVVPDDSNTSLVITETIGGIADHEVEGNTAVAGSLQIAGSEVTEATFTADMTTLEFTDAPPGFDVANRARAMENTGLDTGEFPEATFALTSPITLPADVTSGDEVTADAAGDLTLHGVTKPITFGVTIKAVGDSIQITPTEFVPIVLADYEMSVQAPGFVADIADQGSFDFDIVLQRG